MAMKMIITIMTFINEIIALIIRIVSTKLHLLSAVGKFLI